MFPSERNMFPDLAESEFGPDSFSSICGKPVCFLVKLWAATPLFIVGCWLQILPTARDVNTGDYLFYRIPSMLEPALLSEPILFVCDRVALIFAETDPVAFYRSLATGPRVSSVSTPRGEEPPTTWPTLPTRSYHATHRVESLKSALTQGQPLRTEGQAPTNAVVAKALPTRTAPAKHLQPPRHQFPRGTRQELLDSHHDRAVPTTGRLSLIGWAPQAIFDKLGPTGTLPRVAALKPRRARSEIDAPRTSPPPVGSQARLATTREKERSGTREPDRGYTESKQEP
ncbi:hypothetical protein LWI29_030593 [Acer saccharum]|uniref:Uncharacterized protein n=1 Tax=Acer saccharum TaxID=4024 RepID=A0AA39RFL7_ACESA|nr:hypothetical protein LWI29_030593 [Acer saccharum]